MTALNWLKANNILYRDIQIDCTIISTKLTSMMNDGVDTGGGYSLNGDVRPDRVWFSRCFVFNGVSISSLSVLNRASLHDLMA